MLQKLKWRPSASIKNLYKRASILDKIRCFFSERGVLEVETPAMSQATVTDVHLVPFKTRFFQLNSLKICDLWLVTSPEYHMKRLLAAGSGPIYQLGRCFRNEEIGRYHNPEFTMLEWYRPYYDIYLLMKEVSDLLILILKCESAELLSYQEVFIHFLKIDPLSADKKQLREIVKKLGEKQLAEQEDDLDTLLQLLFMLEIEPKIGLDKPTFIYHFPASQAALAKINARDSRVAERFEAYYKGIELANGFHEVTNSHEQQQRFSQDKLRRAKIGLSQYPIDHNLLDALEHGEMPSCSGVALGIDRLIMLALQAHSISEVISFTVDRC